jgi:hypothetical protein
MRPFRARAGNRAPWPQLRDLGRRSRSRPRRSAATHAGLSPAQSPGRRSLTAAPVRARQRARRRSRYGRARHAIAGDDDRPGVPGVDVRTSARRYACRPDSALMGRPTTSGSPPGPSAALALCRHAARTAPDVTSAVPRPPPPTCLPCAGIPAPSADPDPSHRVQTNPRHGRQPPRSPLHRGARTAPGFTRSGTPTTGGHTPASTRPEHVPAGVPQRRRPARRTAIRNHRRTPGTSRSAPCGGGTRHGSPGRG